jgi:hypothetical protein
MTDEARAADSPPRPAVHIPSPVYLYVIFDGPSGPESGRFVEVEDENGQGVSAGKWEERGDGFWTLGPFLQPPAEVAASPDTNLGAMVEAILEEAQRRHDFLPTQMAAQLATIFGSAERLAVALEQREGVIGDMVGAMVDAEALIAEELEPADSEPSGRSLAVDTTRDLLHLIRTTLAKYRGEQ